MRTVGMGIGLGIGLVLLVASASQEITWAQTPSRTGSGQPAAEGSLVAIEATASDGGRQITLVDCGQRVMCVYHIDPASGAVSLQSVRNIRWDLMVDDFNGVNPSPQEIRALVGQKR